VTGLLIILPSPTGAPAAVGPATRIAGLPLLRRIVLTAARAGLTSVLVPSLVSELGQLAGTTATVLSTGEPLASRAMRRLVFLPATVIPRADWLAGLLAMPLARGRLHVAAGTVCVIDAADPDAVLGLVAGCRSLDDVVAALGPRFPESALAAGAGGRFALTAAADLDPAERWLLRGLIKPNEGFMSRHFERTVSLAITRRLCPTRITPNQMTLVSLAVGFACAPFFVSPARGYQVAGALLFLAHSILDGCDGELARLKFLESRWGALLDAVGDNTVHSVVFACMALGWSRHTGSAWPLILGAVAIASTLAVALVVHGRGMRASTAGGPPTLVSRLADQAVYRDFIYVILILGAFGRAWWFLALTAVGAPVFLIVLAWLGRQREYGRVSPTNSSP